MGAEKSSILAKVAAGEAGAVQECLDSYGGLVWSLARRQGLRREDAEDAVQEIFVEIWSSAGRYDSSKSSEAAFVCMIARRRLIDRLRREQRRPRAATMAPEVSEMAGEDLDRLERGAEAALAHRALAKLRPEERKVLLLSVYQGLSHGQISDATGIPLGTVKTYIRRGLIRVREMLTPGGTRLEEVGA